MIGNPKRDEFFKIMDRQGISLTFDDIRLKTSYSNVSPTGGILKTRFSRNIDIEIPYSKSIEEKYIKGGLLSLKIGFE